MARGASGYYVKHCIKLMIVNTEHADARTLVVGHAQKATEHSLRQHLGSGTVCRLT